MAQPAEIIGEFGDRTLNTNLYKLIKQVDVFLDQDREEKRTQSPGDSVSRIDSFEEGRDEMNLAEFPLSAISDRFLDGRKTVVIADHVWDKDRRELVDRELAISGSDRYGLPTAKDEDVLLACVQLSSLGEFQGREVHFSRYELLKLLRWADESKNYRRLATSLRRWKGVTIYSNRAFYDHARKSWVNRDFSIFDNLNIYERESSERASAPASSWFVWNEVLFQSFQAGYLKRLDWDLYCRLTDPVAKRLYRLLDKRFYHGDEVVLDLHELAIRKVRLSDRYNTAQIKRALGNGIRELEALWELRPLQPERRFVKRERGKWEIVFQKRKVRHSKTAEKRQVAALVDLGVELARRGIGPATAEELVDGNPSETVRTMLELFDWYLSRGKAKGPGFLVDSIRNASRYQFPPGFIPSAQRGLPRQPSNSRKPIPREFRERLEDKRAENEVAQPEPFMAFWSNLLEADRNAFEAEAIKLADPMKRDGYLRLKELGGLVFDQYKQVILRDHFQRSQAQSA